jgi:hypothetical protein
MTQRRIQKPTPQFISQSEIRQLSIEKAESYHRHNAKKLGITFHQSVLSSSTTDPFIQIGSEILKQRKPSYWTAESVEELDANINSPLRDKSKSFIRKAKAVPHLFKVISFDGTIVANGEINGFNSESVTLSLKKSYPLAKQIIVREG